MKKIIVVLVAILFSSFIGLFSQEPIQYGTPFDKVPGVHDAIFYQVNIRAFSDKGNFQGVIERLDKIKELGINVVYLMPIYPVGTLKAFNSPYCVKNYKEVNPEFGTLDDLRQLVDSAHKLGMAVMLDWVANHTSWDNVWMTEHKDWYKTDANGNIVVPNGWNDVAQLDFSNTEMRAAMIEAMRYWVLTANIDGFRCDYADNPPVDFWKQTIDSLRAIKTHKLLMFSEGTRSANFTAGFDYIFGMHFYWNSLKPIFIDNQSATIISNSNSNEFVNATKDQEVIRYLTNHDVNGGEGTPLELFGGIMGSTAAFVVAAYMKGVPMVYNGQEVAFPTRITFPFTSVNIDWTKNADVTAEYAKILKFRSSNETIKTGTLRSYSNADVCAFTKTSASERVLVMVNLRNKEVSFKISSTLVSSNWKDAYTQEYFNLESTLTLPAYAYVVLTNSQITAIRNPFKEGQEISVFPNPVKSGQKISIQVPDNSSFQSVAAFDVTGNLLFKKKLETDFSPSLKPGIYFLKFQNESLNEVVKLVVE